MNNYLLASIISNAGATHAARAAKNISSHDNGEGALGLCLFVVICFGLYGLLVYIFGDNK